MTWTEVGAESGTAEDGIILVPTYGSLETTVVKDPLVSGYCMFSFRIILFWD